MHGGVDLAALGAGCERDAFDEATDSRCRLVALLRAPECFCVAFYFAPIDAGDVRVIGACRAAQTMEL